jgi:hypothetical protein
MRTNWTKKSVFLSIAIGTVFLATERFAEPSHYFDGDQRIEIREERGMLAETGLRSSALDLSLVKRSDPKASLVKESGNIKVWKTDPTQTKNTASKVLGSQAASRLVAVYRSPGGSILIPTGNMIVYFQMDRTESQIQVWAAQKGLRVLQKMPFSHKNAWEIETTAGSQSIEIANAVREEAGIEAAIPNFWMEFSQK